jgi:uncharacterized damage-inducible protein DinB
MGEILRQAQNDDKETFVIDPQAELIEINRTTPVVLRTLVRGIDRQRARRAGEGEWAVIQVVAHLADAEERAVERVRVMSTEDQPQLFGYDQEELAEKRGYLEMDLGEQLDRFERLRNERVAILSTLDAAGWARIGRHNQYGPITIHDLMAHMAKHDAIHLAQVARLVDELQRESDFAFIEKMRKKFDGISPEEIERETDAAIAELREHKRARSKPNLE